MEETYKLLQKTGRELQVPAKKAQAIVQLSSKKFLLLCAASALGMLGVGAVHPFSSGAIAVEVFLTIIALFVFGSIRYQLDKNALTYGAVMVISATFATSWWPTSGLRQSLEAEGLPALWAFISHHAFTLRGLDHLIHADTMLFILGLTLFVSVIAQTRILETVSFLVLKKNKGFILPTFGILAGLVSFASGILDGVSMIGLLIRTMIIILFLSKIKEEMAVFAVIVSTVITTVCGMWLAYGEPPNLIMKANLHPHLTDGFFLRYCLPIAMGSFFIVLRNLRRQLRGRRVTLDKLDILDTHTADVRFLQASQRGNVPMPIEFVEEKKEDLGPHYEAVLHRLHRGEPLGSALVAEDVPVNLRKKLLGQYISPDLAEALDRHYVEAVSNKSHSASTSEFKIAGALNHARKKRLKAQWIGGLSFIPFISLLAWHGINHSVYLFWSSFAAFAVALIGIFPYKKTRKLALREARHEYAEYLFLFPLFFSITLLQKSGFFGQMSAFLHSGIDKLGVLLIAYIQYAGAVVLSALLDNNVVADFASRALHGLELGILHLFAMAQIAGYAVGGCWTHIGSAQSVVAYAFIKREIDENFSPFQWIKMMTPIIIEISLLMIAVVYGQSFLTGVLGK